VQERTSQLNETHQQLVESIQKSAVSMVEITALQERNRIAQEIHDIVGHTLTTTILQIEASKRLLDKNITLAKEKMDTSQELVRKGLDEIRGSVRMLKEADWFFDLKSSLEKLIQETIKHVDVEIDADISDIPNMTEIQKSTIYLALKEGLTNGLKHGQSKKFHFTLKEENKAIKFVLKNDGQPFQAKEFGFGLSAMSERIEQLNGTLKIYPEDEWGCILNIHLPF
jgi:signal transduction histidine kinase